MEWYQAQQLLGEIIDEGELFPGQVVYDGEYLNGYISLD